ncbi:hypothetical protein [Rhizobium sp. Rhizsp82]|uniref:COG3904 family protein n=1 Tax=Rhizobium sp. Rhizsp82 TaxID=3243057 RepID=UPI0039B674AC
MKKRLAVAAVLACLLQSEANAHRMTFTDGWSGGNCNDCEFTIADGTIDDKTVDDYRKSNKSGRILINSDGGSVLGAIVLGREFRKEGVRIEVLRAVREGNDGPFTEQPGICESACTYAFMGGEMRSVPEGSKFGIHSFATQAREGNDPVYSAADITNVQILSGVLLGHAQAMGVDPIIVQMASEEPSDSMRYLTAEELRALRVTWNPALADPFHLEPFKNGLVAVAATADKNSTVTLFCSQRRLRLMIAQPVSWTKEDDSASASVWLKSIDEKMGIASGSSPFLRFSFRSDGRYTYRTVDLTSDVVETILKMRNLGVAFGQVRGDFEADSIVIPVVDLAVFIRLVTKNCI